MPCFPLFLAANNVAPDPMKGSSTTVSAFVVKHASTRSTKATGNIAGCLILNSSGLFLMSRQILMELRVHSAPESSFARRAPLEETLATFGGGSAAS